MYWEEVGALIVKKQEVLLRTKHVLNTTIADEVSVEKLQQVVFVDCVCPYFLPVHDANTQTGSYMTT